MDERQLKEQYETPERTVYGDVEELTQGSTPSGVPADVASRPAPL